MDEPGGDFKVRGREKRRVKPRTLVTLAIVVALAVVAVRQREAILDVVRAMSQGALMPLLLAGVCEFGRIVFHAYAYTRSFRTVGYDVPLRATIPAWFKAVFMNTVLPSGGTSGLAAVIDTARARGVPVGSATTGTLFTQTCFYTAMMMVIVIGWFVMGRSGSLHVRDVLVGSVVGVAALAFICLLALGHLKPGLLQRMMRAVERTVTRVCAKLRLKGPAPWADSLVHSFSSAATELSRHPRRAGTVLLSMVVAMAFDALAFIASGMAFGITALDALFGGYVTALVFNSFNVTPGGVGIVEGLAAAVLAGYGFPGTLAVSAVLTYRAFMYWIPFAVGGVAMRLTRAFGAGKDAQAGGIGEDAAEKPGDAAAEKSRGRVVEMPGGMPRGTDGGAGGAARRADVRSAATTTSATFRTARAGARRGTAGPTAEQVAASVAAAADRVASRPHEEEQGPVYVQRRRSRVPFAERLLGFARDRIESRTLLCALAVTVTAAFGLFSAAFPPDPVMVAIVIDNINLSAPLAPAWLAVASYLLMLSVPGILIHDQGNWIFGIAGLLFLGVMTGLTAHGLLGMVLVVASLALLVMWQGCFTGHDFLRSVARLTVVLVYAALVALLFVLLGAVGARESIAPDPGYGGTVWLGMQALVSAPGAEGLDVGGPAYWYFSSARAIAVAFTVCVGAVVAMLAVRRALLRRDPAYLEARDKARAEAEAAAAERREARRAVRAERAQRRRAHFAELSHAMRNNTADLAGRARDMAVRGIAAGLDALANGARKLREDVDARRTTRRESQSDDEDVVEADDVVIEDAGIDDAGTEDAQAEGARTGNAGVAGPATEKDGSSEDGEE